MRMTAAALVALAAAWLSAPAVGARADAYTDGFEAASLDPGWIVTARNGSAVLDRARSHSGQQSVALNAAGMGQRDIWLTRQFDRSQGELEVWFYDPMTAALYAGLYASDSANAAHEYAVNVADWSSTHYIWHGPGVSETRTSLIRTVGWHELKLRFTDDGFEAVIDGTVVGSVTGNFSFDTVRLLVSGPGGTGTFWFDDFRYIPPAAAEPPTRLAFGLGPHTPPNGGWLSFHAGLDGDGVVKNWQRLPWPTYNASGGATRLASGDVDGDGLDEVVVGLAAGGSGWIAIFDDGSHGHALIRWIRVPWPAYNAVNGEVWPAVGDLDGDGRAEIVAGLGRGSDGWFAIFDDASASFAHTSWQRVSWHAYFTLGDGATHPAVANLDGAGASEIVLGLGRGSGGWLEILEGTAGGYRHRSWLQVEWPGYNDSNGATFPAAGNLDADAAAEIVIGLGSGGSGWIELRGDSAGGHAHQRWLRSTWPAYNVANGETHPAIGNLDADAAAEIVIGLGSGGGGWFQIFDDAASTHASRGWRQVPWPAFARASGALYPAVGRFQP